VLRAPCRAIAAVEPVKTVIREASSERDYEAFARLIGEYVAWMRTRYGTDTQFVCDVLDTQSLSRELADLSTRYGAPYGRALLAVSGDEVRACGAYRRLDGGACEMKRVFVPGRFRGTGLGRALCNALIASAREEGFRFVRLDTGRLFTEAIAMYRSMGFRERAAYYECPANLAASLLFMELSLDGEGAASR
jgi:GNAT superfamily N-acetyltransferase